MKVFENLKYQHLKTLLDVANGSKQKSIEIIRRRHQSLSDNFKGASAFLKELHVLSEKKDTVDVSKTFQISTNGRLGDETLKGLLLKELFTTKSGIAQYVLEYLEKYDVVRGTFEYKPTTTSRVKESHLRNLLMDFELVEYNKTTGTYKIKEIHFDAFEVFLSQKKLNPKELAVILKRKEDLGKAAELEILKYEQERLASYPELLERIEYISVNDVKAGYDILSWEKESKKGNVVPRYIEVKAVSKYSYSFFWSRNEMEKAKKYADLYHLYLLPVVGKKKFNTGRLEIISNPIINVFDKTEKWNRQVETYLFSKEVN